MTVRQDTSSLRKRMLLGTGLLLSAVLVCFVLIIALAPKAINRDAFRSRIETTISNTLGGTVTYDRLDLVLFPRPELEFRNLKIVVPGAVSAAIDALRIRAKLIPLFLGRFEVSSVAIDRPAVDLYLPDAATRATARNRKPEPASRSLDEVLAVADRAMPDLALKISGGKLFLRRGEAPGVSIEGLDAALAFVPKPEEDGGRSGAGPQDRYRLAGKAQCTLAGVAALPGQLRLSVKRFEALPGRLTVSGGRIRILDADLEFTGSLGGHFSTEPRPDITMRGTIGRGAADWLRSLAGLPQELAIRSPLDVSKMNVRASGTGPSLSQTVAGSVETSGGAALDFALRNDHGRFSVDKLHIKDRESDATLAFAAGPDGRVLSFSGSLTNSTLQALFTYESFTFGRLTGNMRCRLPADRLSGISAEGVLEGERIGVPSFLAKSLLVERFSVTADGGTLFVLPSLCSLGTATLSVQGAVSYADDRIALDLDMATARADVQAVRNLLTRESRTGTASAAPEVGGELRIRAGAFSLGAYAFEDLMLVVTPGTDRTELAVQQASLCGVGLDGTLLYGKEAVDLDLQAKAKGGALDTSLNCLLRENAGITGSFDLSARFTGSSPWDSLPHVLRGRFDLSATNGRIHSTRIVKGIIVYLNSTSMFKDSRTSLLQEGVPYDIIAFRGSLRDDVIGLTEALIRGKEVHIAAEGSIDLRAGTLSLNVLAAPFTTLDRLLGKIPLVKYIAGNALIVVPAKVEGSIDKPNVKAMPISSVGRNITNLMKNIAEKPVKIVEPNAASGRDR